MVGIHRADDAAHGRQRWYSYAESPLSGGGFVGGIRAPGDNELSPVVYAGGTLHSLPAPGRLGVALVTTGQTIVGLSFGVDGSRNDIAVWQNEQLLGLVTNLPGLARTVFDINSTGRYVGLYGITGGYGGFIGQGLDAATSC